MGRPRQGTTHQCRGTRTRTAFQLGNAFPPGGNVNCFTSRFPSPSGATVSRKICSRMISSGSGLKTGRPPSAVRGCDRRRAAHTATRSVVAERANRPRARLPRGLGVRSRCRRIPSRARDGAWPSPHQVPARCDARIERTLRRSHARTRRGHVARGESAVQGVSRLRLCGGRSSR